MSFFATRERGQALVLALLILFLLSVAAALMAADLGLRQRAMLEEEGRFRLRQLLDAALSDALCRRAADERFRGLEQAVAGGTLVSVVEDDGVSAAATVRVEARYRGRSGAAVARVQVRPGPIRVLDWRRSDTGG